MLQPNPLNNFQTKTKDTNHKKRMQTRSSAERIQTNQNAFMNFFWGGKQHFPFFSIIKFDIPTT